MSTDTNRTNRPSHEIIIVDSKEQLQQCFDVRIEVFHHEQKFPLELELDDKEDISTHFLLRLTPSFKPIGTIRGYLVTGTTHTYKLTRLAILQEYRKYGFGRELVSALHTWVKAHASGSLTPSPDIQSSDTIPSIRDTTSQFSTTTNSAPTCPLTIEVIAHSQIYAKGFYAKFGYAPEGDEFIEDGDPHQRMVLRIPISISISSP